MESRPLRTVGLVLALINREKPPSALGPLFWMGTRTCLGKVLVQEHGNHTTALCLFEYPFRYFFSGNAKDNHHFKASLRYIAAQSPPAQRLRSDKFPCFGVFWRGPQFEYFLTDHVGFHPGL